ncbi:type II toxin-antitoxin system RelE family toxin [Sphaerobacter thermophilus]|uniref:type II toxin-antitoxin system RelE family toxin n=1 Tax=Sphaerobacter thermophilus TaxID=2057 RepID=UPI0023569042|nr:type II toxin-antitoxin system RelE/ParE family toxin [Sphaerobacter thermophilus]
MDFTPQAVRQLASLPKAMQARIARRIDNLATDPRPQGCEKITGGDDLYRIRVGDYRVVYQVRDERLLILVILIGHRRDIYCHLSRLSC